MQLPNGRPAVLAGMLAAAALAASPGYADEMSALAQRSGCLACHRGVAERIGPPFMAVAGKYAGQKDAEAKLADHILKGTGPDGQGWMKAGHATLPAMPANGNLSPGNAARLAKWVLGIKGEVADPSQFVSNAVTVSGVVANPLKLTVEDLKQFRSQQLGETKTVCLTGTPLGNTGQLTGVLLKDILDRAAIVTKGHNDVKKMAIVASATDDYKVVFSWNEIFNSPLGEGVLVFFEKDGQPLGDEEGRIALISSKDTRTGPRHVNWLNGIEVRRIVD